MVSYGLERKFPVQGRPCFISPRFEEGCQKLKIGRGVIDDEDIRSGLAFSIRFHLRCKLAEIMELPILLVRFLFIPARWLC